MILQRNADLAYANNYKSVGGRFSETDIDSTTGFTLEASSSRQNNLWLYLELMNLAAQP